MITGFPPVVDSKSQILILGSMPSVKSLQNVEYYAYKQNRFWKIFSAFYKVELTTYDEKLALLKKHHIALWDMIAMCEREGSLDSQIKKVVCNDITGLLKQYPTIKYIVCNGKKAGHLYTSIFQKDVDLPFYIMPSTSPANGGYDFTKLMDEYLCIFDLIND